MNKISVVVPCFNEEEVLSMFYKKTSEVLNEIEELVNLDALPKSDYLPCLTFGLRH